MRRLPLETEGANLGAMMSEDAARRKVFSRARLGGLELRNRIVKTAT
jgi:hypothetical protein